MLRLQSNPWLGPDRRVAVDLARAVGVGLRYVLVSHAGVQDLEGCLLAAERWHRRDLNLHPFRAPEELMPGVDRAPTVVIPQPETEPRSGRCRP